MADFRARAVSFGDDAEAYDRYRPSYPDALIDDLMADDPSTVADIGCGTGIAARLFVARGCRVVGVEPDERMAAVARRHGVEVSVVAFEDWQPDESFDLLTSAQAWHWVDAARGSVKAAAVLGAGGRFAAFWNSYEHAPDAREALTRVYEKNAPEFLDLLVTLGRIQADDPLGNDHFGATLRATGAFENVERRSYVTTRRYTTDAWLNELATHSDHRTLEPTRRTVLLDELRACVDSLGGELDVQLRTGLITARRHAS